jgi:hypothetical protein
MTGSCWDLYEYPPSFVIGFHGCDESVGESVLSGRAGLKPSKAQWDWLGHGIYFWEGNPQRALVWAQEREKAGRIKSPFVIGAVLDLGHCLDLMDSGGLKVVKDAYDILREVYLKAGMPLPENTGREKAARKLDCLVINSLHDYRERRGLAAYDTVRAVFPEGDELYPGAGFRDRNHVQICARNGACIKGYFRPIQKI